MALPIGKTLKEIEKDLKISRSTIYRSLTRLGYSGQVIGKDKFATTGIYILNSDVYAKEMIEANRRLCKLVLEKEYEITKLQEENKELRLQLVQLPEFDLPEP